MRRSRFALDITFSMRQLKFVSMHYVYGAEQRVMWVRGPQDPWRRVPRKGHDDHGSCRWTRRAARSTVPYAALVMTVNRDCEA
ncbi:hypothetical protein MTO96_033336 [Rhipicephalus appendiculatus]